MNGVNPDEDGYPFITWADLNDEDFLEELPNEVRAAIATATIRASVQPTLVAASEAFDKIAVASRRLNEEIGKAMQALAKAKYR